MYTLAPVSVHSIDLRKQRERAKNRVKKYQKYAFFKSICHQPHGHPVYVAACFNVHFVGFCVHTCVSQSIFIEFIFLSFVLSFHRNHDRTKKMK